MQNKATHVNFYVCAGACPAALSPASNTSRAVPDAGGVTDHTNDQCSPPFSPSICIPGGTVVNQNFKFWIIDWQPTPTCLTDCTNSDSDYIHEVEDLAYAAEGATSDPSSFPDTLAKTLLQYGFPTLSLNTIKAISFREDTTPFPTVNGVPKGTQQNPLQRSDIENELTRFIQQNNLPLSSTFGSTAITNIYIVLTGANVESCGQFTPNLCSFPTALQQTYYCGYHDFLWTEGPPITPFVNYETIVYIYLPDPKRGPNPPGVVNCGTPTSPVLPVSPFSSVFSAVTDTESHEIAETVTDPVLNAWFNSTSVTFQEIGDLCGQTYGTIAPDGSDYRVPFAYELESFIVQQEWSNSANACSLGS
jgi:hypothetical protein